MLLQRTSPESPDRPHRPLAVSLGFGCPGNSYFRERRLCGPHNLFFSASGLPGASSNWARAQCLTVALATATSASVRRFLHPSGLKREPRSTVPPRSSG